MARFFHGRISAVAAAVSDPTAGPYCAAAQARQRTPAGPSHGDPIRINRFVAQTWLKSCSVRTSPNRDPAASERRSATALLTIQLCAWTTCGRSCADDA